MMTGGLCTGYKFDLLNYPEQKHPMLLKAITVRAAARLATHAPHLCTLPVFVNSSGHNLAIPRCVRVMSSEVDAAKAAAASGYMY